MSTTSKTVIKTKEEIKYERRVKSIELAIKTQGNKGMMSKTVVTVAGEIFAYLNS